MKLPKTVSLKCLFCGLEIQMEETKSKQLQSGDRVKCTYCNETNDFDSMFKVAEKEAVKMVDLAIQKELNNMFK